MKEEWEDIDEGEDGEHLKRMKVFGGWLVFYSCLAGEGMTFVPDKKHEWKIED